jgi:mitochondrial cardiolipin hydrolase
MHHKFAVFDARTLLTGSYNWTRSADEYNKDNFLVTDDPHLVQAFSATFDRLWARGNV